jgi:hypothetical protein
MTDPDAHFDDLTFDQDRATLVFVDQLERITKALRQLRTAVFIGAGSVVLTELATKLLHG